MNNYKLSKNAKNIFISVCRAIILISFSVILLYPLLFMVSNAFKTRTDVLNPSVEWFARQPSFYSFKIAYQAMDYMKSFLNTFKFGIISGLIEIFSCAVYAYSLARFKMKLKPLFIFFLITIIFVPDIILVIPRVINFRYMDLFGILGLFNKITSIDLRPNLTDTVWTFWLPSVFGVGLKGGIFIFIYMQFFKGLPKELEEAAWIDGAGPVKTFIKIIIPSSGVVILTVFIFSMVWHWNDWLLSIMYTSSNRTLAVQIYDITNVITRWTQQSNTILDPQSSYGIPLAACILFIIPPMVMYGFLQKYFIQSIDKIGIVG